MTTNGNYLFPPSDENPDAVKRRKRAETFMKVRVTFAMLGPMLLMAATSFAAGYAFHVFPWMVVVPILLLLWAVNSGGTI